MILKEYYWVSKKLIEGKILMKYKVLLAILLSLTVASCDIFDSQKFADVIMVDGPRNEGGDTTFFFTGTVRNIGTGKALSVKVTIVLKNPNDDFLAQKYHLVDKTDLKSGESSAWRVTFQDEDYELRDLMDESKTSYSISWNEGD